MSENQNDEGSTNTKNILVVGDWVVDEHWVTGIHRSLTSSRTGMSHRRALHSLVSTTQSFCGAGQTASILHQATYNNGKKFCNIFGVGIWHDDDTEILATMLDPTKAKGHTPHKLLRKVESSENINRNLFNLGKVIEGEHGTIRIMRIYQHTGAKIDLIQRLDWEIPFQYDETGWVTDNKMLNNDDLNIFMNKNYDAVIIKDLRKGVVTNAMIKWLVNRKCLKNIPWFISSKEWMPDWFQALSKVKLKLLLIPQVASEMAVRKGILNSWLTKSGYASKESLVEIDKLAKDFNEKPLIVVLPDGLSILARDYKTPQYGWRQKNSEIHPLAVGMPMASVFISALAANILNDDRIALDNLLKNALDFTQEWMEFEVGRITEPIDWPTKEEPPLKLEINSQSGKVGDWEKFDWVVAQNEWNQAFVGQGIIDREGKKIIELKRAMTEVDGYVCIVNSRREKLRKLAHDLKSFKSRGKQHPVSCMLIDSPGSGKTFLVRCIARLLKMRYLPFNITQMFSKEDILDCFDTIVTTQARNREEEILVFFDEINATLESQQVYDTFLAPLEEGVYIRAGKTFYIDPCVWVFAGTERPVKKDDPQRDPSSKASDFESRLTIEEPLNLKINTDDKTETLEARLEKVYLGVSLLRTFFPDVRRISEKVLQLFHLLSPNLEVRKVEHFVKSFVNIQYGVVSSKNVPLEWLEKHESSIDTGQWNNESEGSMVEIIG